MSAPARTISVSGVFAPPHRDNVQARELPPASFEFGPDECGAAGDVGHDPRAAFDDLVKGRQPFSPLEFDGGTDRRADFLDLLREPIGEGLIDRLARQREGWAWHG